MAQSKQQTLPNTTQSASLEGGTGEERNPDAAAPSAERPRNSSGSASLAASVLDLRVKVTTLSRQVAMLCALMGFKDLEQEITRGLQQGFRRGR